VANKIFYHGSPTKLTTLGGESGLFVTPKKGIASLFTLDKKELLRLLGSPKSTSWGYPAWNMPEDQLDDLLKEIIAKHSVKGAPKLTGVTDGWIYKLELDDSKLKQFGKSPLSREAIYTGEQLSPLEATNVKIPYSAEFDPEELRRLDKVLRTKHASVKKEGRSPRGIYKLPDEELSFTIGDSFPALYAKAGLTDKIRRYPYSDDLMRLEEIMAENEKGRLARRLDRIYRNRKRKGSSPDDYVEAQIWDTPENIAKLVKTGSAVEKLAEDVTETAILKTKLLNHQRRVVDKIKSADRDGLLVYHGLGSGKTLTSIAAATELNMPVTVIAPASLQSNYAKELHKHLGGIPDNVNIISYNKALANPSLIGTGLVVIDEVHNLGKKESKRSKLLERASMAKKRLFLTGTPVRNDPSEIAPIINAIAGEDLLPENKADFYTQYVAQKQVDPGFVHRLRGVTPGVDYKLKNKQQLAELVRGLIDYEAAKGDEFPGVKEKHIYVPMSEKQQKVYDFVAGNIPFSIRYKMENMLPPSKAESRGLNNFLQAVRQVANTPAAYDGGGFGTTPADAAKLVVAKDNLIKHLNSTPHGKALIYSNYLDSGVRPYSDMLKDEDIAYGMLTGDIPMDQRAKMVDDYNKDVIKALLISSAGGEGLDLKGTSLIQVLEPHWNDEKLNQIKGRGVRYQSHSHLPEDAQNVTVENYISVRPQTYIQKLLGRKADASVDEYLRSLSSRKDLLNKELLEVLKSA